MVFFLPMAFFGFGSAAGSETFEIVASVVGFVFYFITTFIMIFFNSALVGAALIRLDGGDPTVADGLRIARERLGSILAWSLLAATVGMILKAARERAGWLGSLVVGMIGIAWNLATFLVVPVLVTRDLGPIDALKESAEPAEEDLGRADRRQLWASAPWWRWPSSPTRSSASRSSSWPPPPARRR